jgi:Fe-S-cluster containining protein
MFIHIGPNETRTLARIPKKILFPAPRMPAGHVVMGYNERGECPMLVENNCSIYADRPQTCRDYDCRVYAATGTLPDEETQPLIAERVRAWEFETPSEGSKRELAAARASAAFIARSEALFPAGSLPRNPAQRAALALRVHRLFLEEAPPRSNSQLVALISQEIVAQRA